MAAGRSREEEKIVDFKLTQDNVDFLIEVLPEHLDPESEFEDAETAAYVREKMDETEWGWCVVKVTARYESFTGVSHLGGCSYDSEEDFREDAYYEQLCNDAFWDLIANMRQAAEALDKVRVA